MDRSEFSNDISDLNNKFGVNSAIKKLDRDGLLAFLQFRMRFLQEELDEAKLAVTASSDRWEVSGKGESRSAAIVDSMIDLMVVAMTTLHAFEVDIDTSWDRVHLKNMEKVVGIKPERPNELGLPDLVKPLGWTPPEHEDNIGLLSIIFDEQ